MSYPEDPCDVCGVVEWSRGVDFERERIIALLEALDTEQWCGTNLQIVALIKGENE